MEEKNINLRIKKKVIRFLWREIKEINPQQLKKQKLNNKKKKNN